MVPELRCWFVAAGAANHVASHHRQRYRLFAERRDPSRSVCPRPVRTLSDLSVQGFDLTQEEIDVLTRTDARTWFWSRELLGHRMARGAGEPLTIRVSPGFAFAPATLVVNAVAQPHPANRALHI